MDSEHSDSETPEEKIKSIKDFSQHSIDGMAQVRDPSLAEELLERFVDGGIEEAEMLERIAWSPFAERLFGQLAEYYQEEQRGRNPLTLASALMGLTEESWMGGGGNLSRRKAMDWLLKLMTIDALFELFGEHLFDDEHPLFGLADADAYWTATIQYYMAKGDHRRAWDEIKKARVGFPKNNRTPPINGDSDDLNEFRRDPNNRCYRASIECLMYLVSELFEAMHKVGRVTSVQTTDRLVYGGSDATRTRVPGLEFAVSLPGCEKYEGRDVLRLSPTGGMALILARYFCDQKNARRRSREGELARAPKLCDLAKRAGGMGR